MKKAGSVGTHTGSFNPSIGKQAASSQTLVGAGTSQTATPSLSGLYALRIFHGSSTETGFQEQRLYLPYAKVIFAP
jgi:hypothetical protein